MILERFGKIHLRWRYYPVSVSKEKFNSIKLYFGHITTISFLFCFLFLGSACTSDVNESKLFKMRKYDTKSEARNLSPKWIYTRTWCECEEREKKKKERKKERKDTVHLTWQEWQSKRNLHLVKQRERSDQVLTRFRVLIAEHGGETVICNKVIICWGHCGETYKRKK